MKITRAISIRQPFVEQILAGTKKYEYRSRLTRIRERVYLYVSKTPADDHYWRLAGLTPGDLPTGRIVGTVEIVDCLWIEREGRYGFKLEDPRLACD